VSNGAANEAAADRQGLPALEAAVGRTIDELRQLRERAAGSAKRTAELEVLLVGFQSGAYTPEEMHSGQTNRTPQSFSHMSPAMPGMP